MRVVKVIIDGFPDKDNFTHIAVSSSVNPDYCLSSTETKSSTDNSAVRVNSSPQNDMII